MTTKELLQLVEKIFTEKLSYKTGWGKNEILVIYKDSVKEALVEMITPTPLHANIWNKEEK